MEKKVNFPLGCEDQAEQTVSSIPERTDTVMILDC